MDQPPPPYDTAMGKQHEAAGQPPFPTSPPPQTGGAPAHIGFVQPPQQPYPEQPFLGPPQPFQGPPQPYQGAPTVMVTSQPVVYPVAGAQQQGGVVVSQNRTVVIRSVAHVPLPPASSRYECPSCRGDIRTRVEYRTGTKTHLVAALLCIFGCWCCVPIPYCCSNDCKDAHHYCPHCDAYIGVTARL